MIVTVRDPEDVCVNVSVVKVLTLMMSQDLAMMDVESPGQDLATMGGKCAGSLVHLLQMKSGHEQEDWQPLDYVEQYINTELMKLIADCTNSMSLAKVVDPSTLQLMRFIIFLEHQF